MLAADIAQATQVILDGGWSDRSVFFEWAITHPTCFPLVAEADGRVVGTGVATVNGRVGWVGAIFVAEDRRRTGLGTALSRAVVEELERQGCVTPGPDRDERGPADLRAARVHGSCAVRPGNGPGRGRGP